MDLCQQGIPRSRIPCFLTLSVGWAVLWIHLIILGATFRIELLGLVDSSTTIVIVAPFALYICFGAPVMVGWTAFMFLKSVLAEGRSSAWLGLFGSLFLLGLWVVLLNQQFWG
jgi:hypothetical protein